MAIRNINTKISIAGNAVTSAPNQAAYEAEAYTLIGGLSELAEISGERGVGNVANLTSGELEIFPTTYDPGTMEITFIADPSDSGQAALEAAYATDGAVYPFQVQFADQTDSTFFSAFVTKANETGGDSDSAVMLTVGLARMYGVPIKGNAVTPS